MTKIRFILYSFLLFLLCGCSLSNITNADKVRLILDTDLGPDYDDVGAMAVMHALADSGYVDILATISSNKSELTILALKSLIHTSNDLIFLLVLLKEKVLSHWNARTTRNGLKFCLRNIPTE